MIFKTYYNLTKPGIIYGNLLTATAGFLFASHWHNSYSAFFAMLVGLGLIIGSGCVFNNVLDRKIDAKMERTKKRSTVTGEVGTKPAIIYASILGLVGSIILGLFTNGLTLEVALTGLVLYVVVYGLAKRKTVYSTLIGSLAGAIPPLVGYTAVTGYIDLAGVILVFILICWQLTHFYAISLYRKKDYKNAGLPVWSVVKGEWSTELQAIGFIALFTIAATSLALLGYCGYIYLVAVLGIGIVWLWYSVMGVGKLEPALWGRKVFLSSLIVILLISVALSLGPVLP